jgi:hypothetical protein
MRSIYMHTSAGRETTNDRCSVEEEWIDRGERWVEKRGEGKRGEARWWEKRRNEKR